MNVKELREKLGYSQQELADKTGIPKDRIAKWEQGKGQPKVKDSNTLSKLFEELFPRETPASDKSQPYGLPEGVELIETNAEAKSFLEKRRAQKNSHSTFMAPLVPAKAQAGYIKSHDQITFLDTLEKYALPPGVDYRGAIWRYFEIEGDSMEPTFHNRDVVLASMVPQMDWPEIRNFYIYIILTETNLFIKRLFRKTAKSWVMISDNEKEYGQVLLPVEEIKELWVFRRHIDSKAPPPKKFEIKV